MFDWIKNHFKKKCEHQWKLIEPIEGMGVYSHDELIQQGGKFQCELCGKTCLSGGTIVMSKLDFLNAAYRLSKPKVNQDG